MDLHLNSSLFHHKQSGANLSSHKSTDVTCYASTAGDKKKCKVVNPVLVSNQVSGLFMGDKGSLGLSKLSEKTCLIVINNIYNRWHGEVDGDKTSVFIPAGKTIVVVNNTSRFLNPLKSPSQRIKIIEQKNRTVVVVDNLMTKLIVQSQVRIYLFGGHFRNQRAMFGDSLGKNMPPIQLVSETGAQPNQCPPPPSKP